mmetsp:Transcript_103765/g.292676  ORF Transcript_103765/g.292676 Transcript_103765/m.292676 type:complete len:88 (-) Transcript_103765:98-361(-)
MARFGIREYFCGANSKWHIVDAILVLIALLDLMALALQTSLGTATFTVMQVIRVSRVTRIARLARSPVFQELTHMMRSIVAGSQTLG